MPHGSQNIQQEGRQRPNEGEASGVAPQSREGQGETLAEEWRPVAGYEGNYEVSNLGNVRSLTRTDGNGHNRRGRLFHPATGSHGYKSVSLRLNMGTLKFCVSRLVAKAFIPNTSNLPEVNHIDGDKQNDNVTNLEWVSSSRNKQHAYDTGLHKPLRPTQCWKARLTWGDADAIKTRSIQGEKAKVLAREFGVTRNAIYAIRKGRSWTHT